ncbi:MAG: N-acetylmuramoyl-L-alanine amidase [Myxococcaceae bacterium]|nr:N-acetylmuramoyl-L-alanine amidase [Myxococcaceae bacterium]
MRAAILSAALLSTAAAAYCPSYTLSSSSNNGNCGIEAAPGTNPTPAQWQAIFALVSNGPSAWGSNGPAVANIGSGCNKPLPVTSIPAKFPCELLKAIAMQESSWKQFCVPESPPDQVGKSSRTIISFDCGYGIGQVTSGMHIGEAPAFDRARVASDPTYNMATGTQILAAKWKATQCVGDNQPRIIEDWYTATWAYNGLAYSNNPSNPNYSSTRGIYNPQVGGTRPYQEKVFGWMEHPPTATHWTVTAVAYPNPATVGSSGAPPALAEPACATPTNCVQTRSVHVSSCFLTDAGTPDAGTPPEARSRPAAAAAPAPAAARSSR